MPSPGRFRMAYDEAFDDDEDEEDEFEGDEDDEDGDDEDEPETWQVERSQPEIVLHRSRARRLTFPR
jgi:hypothetical protein